MTDAPRHALLCYDGSPEAARAIEVAGRLLGGGRVTVLYAWQSAAEALARYGTPVTYVPDDDFDRDLEHARGVARQGADLAGAAGFEPEPRTAHSAAPPWAAILRASEELEVDLIVLGARGLTGFKSVLLGSVSHHLVNLARLPTLVIPPARPAGDDSHQELMEIPVRLDA
jgi:nucleotide-binding universal stress UspA family protein